MNEKNVSALYDQRKKRIFDAVNLKEPDRVPILMPGSMTFPYHYYKVPVSEVVYDADKAQEVLLRFLEEFQPDIGYVMGAECEGMGKIFEKSQHQFYRWAGMPEKLVSDYSGHQFVEFEMLLDEEFDEILHDRSLWQIKRYLPRAFGLLKPLEDIPYPDSFMMDISQVAFFFARPDVQNMVKELVELAGMYGEYYQKVGAMVGAVNTAGFPTLLGQFGISAFDEYSCFLRGTMKGCTDLLEYEDELDEILEIQCQRQERKIKEMPYTPDTLWYLTLTKGMDGFMSDEQYERFYWKYLIRLVNAIIEKGMTPYIFGEGYNDSRIKYLEQLPPGKTIFHIEKTHDLKAFKERLSGICALSGAYPVTLLERGTPEQCVEKFKEVYDILGPNGGYLFDTDCSLENCKPENLKALYSYIKENAVY